MGDGPMVSEEVLNGRTLMLFDGLCGLCTAAVLWVIKHDHADRFRFAPHPLRTATADSRGFGMHSTTGSPTWITAASCKWPCN